MVVEELMLGPARVSQDGGTQQVGTRAAEQGAAAETQGEPPAKGLSQGRCVPPGGFSPTPSPETGPEGGAGGPRGTRTLLRGASSCPRRSRELGGTQRGRGQGERRPRWLSRRIAPALPLLVTLKIFIKYTGH